MTDTRALIARLRRDVDLVGGGRFALCLPEDVTALCDALEARLEPTVSREPLRHMCPRCHVVVDTAEEAREYRCVDLAPVSAVSREDKDDLVERVRKWANEEIAWLSDGSPPCPTEISKWRDLIALLDRIPPEGHVPVPVEALQAMGIAIGYVKAWLEEGAPEQMRDQVRAHVLAADNAVRAAAEGTG